MNVTVNSANGGAQIDIKVHGRFDHLQHEAFRKASTVVPASGGRYVVDLGHTEYIDSSALGMLLLLHDRANRAGATVSVCNCAAGVRRVLEIANLDKLFEVS